MSNHNVAGGHLVDIKLIGDNNNISVFVDRAGLDAELAGIAPKRSFKIMLCGPSNQTGDHLWDVFIRDLTKTLTEKGFEIIEAGSAIERKEAEPIYLAEQRHLADKDCRAVLIFACDYVTVSQLTHLTSSLFGKDSARKDIIVISDDHILRGERYFEEGALNTARNVGEVIALPADAVPNASTIDRIVSRLMLIRNVAMK